MKKLLVIVGPTAVGKSTLAVEIARRFNGEIISADSRQVYRGLNVGTGKITKKEMRGVPHHLLNVASPKRQFTVAEYQALAREKIAQIFSRGRMPIICGGTGLYIDAALGRIVIPEVPPNPELRRKLEKKSAVQLFALLQKLDQQRAKTIDPHNPRRLVRAIEIVHSFYLSPFSKGEYHERSEWGRGGTIWNKPPPCLAADGSAPARPNGRSGGLPLIKGERQNINQVIWLGLTLSPEELKKKIAIRLFSRLRQGFGGQARIEKDMITEVRRLHKRGLSWKRMDALGLEYRYISRYLCGMLTETEMTEKLQTEIYRYAKRQMTWFKRNKEIQWFNPSQETEIMRLLEETLIAP